VSHYQNAPITEALVDIQVRLPSETTIDAVRAALGTLGDRFTNVGKLNATSFSLGEEKTAIEKPTLLGLAFRSKDNKNAIQTRLNGFGFSRLSPYENWEGLRDEARGFWSMYRANLKPEAITRLTIKYVNRFDIPLPVKDLKDFFRTVPEISPDMPQDLSGFFMQLLIPYPELMSMLVLTQTLVPPPRTGIVSVGLDIELNCMNNVPFEDDDIWNFFEKFRVAKNSIFEASITDAARELIR
jgi:uncharacterized protein (TIGR04255 family)